MNPQKVTNYYLEFDLAIYAVGLFSKLLLKSSKSNQLTPTTVIQIYKDCYETVDEIIFERSSRDRWGIFLCKIVNEDDAF